MTALTSDTVLVVQAGLVLAILEAVRRRNVPAAVNGLVALGAALLPAAVRIGLRVGPGIDVTYGPALPFWLAVAALVHTVGMLGLYDTVWWWDHLAHAISAALVTALTYAAALVVARDGSMVPLSSPGVVGLTVGYLLLLGVCWELVEQLARHLADRYDIGPLLVIYGPYDAAFDLVFNLVGAGLVLLLDLRLFVPVFEPHPQGTALVLVGVGGAALTAAVLIGLFLVLASDDWP